MTKTAITNDKPKGEVSETSKIALTVAMELGRALGRAEAQADKDGAPAAPVQNTRDQPFGFKVPHNLHLAPKADGTTPISNNDGQTQHRPPAAIKGYKVPKAED